MSKNNENKLVPKLRFPEFLKDKEWQGDELGKLSSFFKGKGLAKSDIVPNGKNPCVHYGELFTKYSEVIKEVRSYTNISEGFKSEANDVLMPTSDVTPNGLAKASCIKLDEIILGGDILVIRPKPIIYGEFLSRFIRHREQEVLKLVSGTTVFHLYGSSFEKFRLSYPSIHEQQKIAACLSLLDEVITAESQKLDILKVHKKGLLQNLLPQEGETVPKFRFEEFEDSGEWEEKSLGDVCSYFKGFAFQSKDYTSNGRRIVRVSDMGFDYIKNETNAIYLNDDDTEQYEKWELRKYDVIVTTVGSKPPSYDSLVGRSIVVEQKDETALLNQNAVCLRANEAIEQRFLNTLFKTNDYITFIKSIIRGNANQGSIALEDLFKYKFLQPSHKEQQKIADTLSSIDELITAQNQKVEVLKLHKKGLLQGLFPTLNNE